MLVLTLEYFKQKNREYQSLITETFPFLNELTLLGDLVLPVLKGRRVGIFLSEIKQNILQLLKGKCTAVVVITDLRKKICHF